MTPYTALVARGILLGRIESELVHAKPGYFREKLIEQREMAIALLIEGMRDRRINVPWPKVAQDYVRQAWEELEEAMGAE